ncbi:hypothetical protein PM082_008345 [Marasmius tenuissimus]|nr:hypothetical protein PM082_008345 [Marasmius tenuissimus]
MSPSFATRRLSERQTTSHQVTLPRTPSILAFRKVREENDSLIAVLMRGDFRTAIENSMLGRNDELLRSVFLQILTALQYRHRVNATHKESTLVASSKQDVSPASGTDKCSSPYIKSGRLGGTKNKLRRGMSESGIENYPRGSEAYLHSTFPTISSHAVTLLTRIIQPSTSASSLSELRAEIMGLDTFFADPDSDDSESDDEEQATLSKDDHLLESYFLDDGQFAQVLELPNQAVDVPVTAARMEYMFELDSRSYASPIGARFDRDGVEGALSPWSAGFGAVWTFGSLTPSCDALPSFPRPSIPFERVDSAAPFLDTDEELTIDEMLGDLYIS